MRTRHQVRACAHQACVLRDNAPHRAHCDRARALVYWNVADTAVHQLRRLTQQVQHRTAIAREDQATWINETDINYC